MKKIVLLMGTISCFAVTAMAQQTYSPENNPTVAAITSKYSLIETNRTPLTDEQVFPALGNYQFTDANNANGTLHVTHDADNKGIIWIDGLPQGKIKAMLRTSPATYKIPAQKTEEGNDVAEGVLIYDQDSKKLSLCVGCMFDQNNPQSAFQTNTDETSNATTSALADNTNQKNMRNTKKKNSKTNTVKKEEEKVKPWIITATKMEPADVK